MVQIDLKALQAFVEHLPTAAILCFEDQWLMNQEVFALSGWKYSHRQPFSEWLSQLDPLQDGEWTDLFFKVHEPGEMPLHTVIRTRDGELVWLEVNGMQWNGARIWLLHDRSRSQRETDALRKKVDQLEFSLNQRTEDLSEILNLLLAARKELDGEKQLLEQIAAKLRLPAEDLSDWCEKTA